jgi:cytochrome c556
MRLAVTLPRVALLAAAFLGVPAAVSAATSLRSVMHSWRYEAGMAGAMLTGRRTYNETEMRRAFQTISSDAGMLAGRITRQSAEAQDFKRRFIGLQEVAQGALGHLSDRNQLHADFSRMISDCRACHNAYN